MFCTKCGTQIGEGLSQCSSCGETVPIQNVEQNKQSPVYQETPPNYSQPNIPQNKQGVNTTCLILIIIAALLWVALPFMSVNIITTVDMPSALKLITGDFFYFGDITQSPGFYAALASCAGIIISFLLILSKKSTRILSVIIVVVLLITMLSTLSWFSSMRITVFDICGIAYWGILVIFILFIIIGGKKKEKTE